MASKSNGPLKIELKLLANGTVKTNILFWEDIAKDTPFRVEPESVVVKAYGKESFNVTLFRTSNVGIETAMLTGLVSFDFNDAVDDKSKKKGPGTDLSSGNDRPSSAGNKEIKKDESRLELVMQAKLLHPSINIDKNTLTASSSVTIVPDLQGIKFKTQAPSLFAKGSGNVVQGQVGGSEACMKPITLSNPTEATIVCAISAEGPFKVIIYI